MTPSDRRYVLHIGPNVAHVGGMATVLSQILSMTFGGRYRTRSHAWTGATDLAESTARRTARHLAHGIATWRRLGRERPEVVHIHTCSGFSFWRSVADLLMAGRCGAKTAMHIHGAAFDAFCDGAGRLPRRIIRWALERADVVVALSGHWARVLSRIAPAARVVVIENAVPPGPPASHPALGDRCRFLFLGRMDEWKGVEDLLRAAVQLVRRQVSFELVLAGPPGTVGDERTLPKRIESLGLADRVRYVGCVQGEDKERLFRECDAFVQPSWHEGMPIALLEALAHELPAAATRVGAVPEVIRDGREGLLTPPRSVDHLAAAMMELALNPIRRRAMGQAGRRLIQQRFSLERLEQDLLFLYDTLLDAKHRSRRPRSVPGAIEPLLGPQSVAISHG